jgi:hypothetical protein
MTIFVPKLLRSNLIHRLASASVAHLKKRKSRQEETRPAFLMGENRQSDRTSAVVLNIITVSGNKPRKATARPLSESAKRSRNLTGWGYSVHQNISLTTRR